MEIPLKRPTGAHRASGLDVEPAIEETPTGTVGWWSFALPWSARDIPKGEGPNGHGVAGDVEDLDADAAKARGTSRRDPNAKRVALAARKQGRKDRQRKRLKLDLARSQRDRVHAGPGRYNSGRRFDCHRRGTRRRLSPGGHKESAVARQRNGRRRCGRAEPGGRKSQAAGKAHRSQKPAAPP